MKKILALLTVLALLNVAQAQIKIKVPQVKGIDKNKDKDKGKDEKVKEPTQKTEEKTVNTSSNNNIAKSAATFREGDVVEVLYEDGKWYEATVFQAGGSGRYQVQYTSDKSYQWVYSDKMRATGKANTIDEEKKRLAGFKQYNVGDMVTWNGGYKNLSVTQITKIESPGVYMTKSGVRLTGDKIVGLWAPKYKIGDKVIVPDRSYGHYNVSTITELYEGKYYLDNSNSSSDESRFWPVWDYQNFYDLFYEKISGDNYVFFQNMQALQRGDNVNASTVTTEKIQTYLAATDAVEKELKAKFTNVPHIDNCRECPEDIMQTLANTRKLLAEHYLEDPSKRVVGYFEGLTRFKVDDLKAGSNNTHKADDWLGQVNPQQAFEADYKYLYDTELKKMEEMYAAIGAKAPAIDKEAAFAKVKALKSEYESALFSKDWLATMNDPFTTKDASLEPMVRQYIKNGTITKIGFAAGDWEKYESTTYWVAGRAKYGLVLVNDPQYQYKVAYMVKISQEYFGSGRYGQSKPEIINRFFYAK